MNYLFEKYFKPAFVIFIAFAIAGICANPARLAALKASPHGIEPSAIRATLGKGMLFGVLGGYRSLVSDFVWIKAYIEWEKKDISACTASIELSTTIDPYMIQFWTQGASMMAFDMPHWIVARFPVEKRTPELLQTVKEKQSKIAIKYLDRALELFPDNSALIMQKGQIAIGAGFFKIAEDCYAKVAAKPDPEIYVRRIYASLLMKNGKFKQALKVLESILPDIDADSPLMQLISDQIEKTKALMKKTQLN